jgi:hypothetical protein
LPERLYVVDAEGIIAYRGKPGPWGFGIDSWEEAIRPDILVGVAMPPWAAPRNDENGLGTDLQKWPEDRFKSVR